ncbi:bile acid:sodium symporter family protein [Yunchengibacter salinarum]|uniref:bile acid:sodium symporter family protein n=1 Tax=Yunchengibacter salinarum TaxID=3133399 RepID=UPI0035B6A78D
MTAVDAGKADPATLDGAVITLDPLMQAGLALVLAFLMLSVALGLKPGHFRFIRTAPTRIVKGALVQIVGLPLVTMALILVLDPAPSIALGMVIVASCPGGNISNLLTVLARGDAAYSVALTALTSVLAVVLVPASILFWTGLYPPTAALVDSIHLDGAAFLARTAFTLGLPLALGIWLAATRPVLAARLRRLFTPLALATLLLVIVAGLASHAPLLSRFSGVIIPLVVVHNGLAFALGAVSGWLLFRARETRRALTFEVGIQNSGLGLVILLDQFAGLGGAALTVAVWGIWHMIGGLIVAALMRGRDRLAHRP